MTRPPREVVWDYLTAWREHDIDALRALLREDAVFSGPLGAAEGAADWAASMERLFAITEDLIVEKLVADGEDVLSWFELHTTGAPPTLVSTFSFVELGKIVRVRAVFDPRPILDGLVGGREETD